MEDCIFCKIVRKEIPTKVVFESEDLIAFPDINPSADIHILMVPKQHIGGLTDIREGDGQLLTKIYDLALQLASDNNLTDGYYRVVVNGGKAQHIPHLHFHFLGGNWWKREE